MYEMMTGLFAVILALDGYAAFRYGFNIIFLYIGLFSIAVVIWGIIAIRFGKKDGKDEPGNG